MRPGSFVAYVPRQPASWIPFLGNKSQDRAVEAKILLIRKSDFPQSEPQSGGQQPPTITILLPGAGIVINPGWRELPGGEIVRAQPFAYRTKTAACIFFGQISNLAELVERLRGVECTPGSPHDLLNNFSSLHQDHGTLAAEVILEMYMRSDGNNPLLLLSELQGEYSFLVFDSSKKHVFAARDPSGRETLFYCVDTEGNLSYSSVPFNVPGGESKSDWIEIPPGHLVSGKTPRMEQFALTPEQLYYREYKESVDDDLSSDCEISAANPYPAYLARKSKLLHRESHDNNMFSVNV